MKMALVIFHPAAFILASLGEHSEYEHLEKILLDAICIEPVEYANGDIESKDKTDKYEKYKSKNYTPTKHEYMERLKK